MVASMMSVAALRVMLPDAVTDVLSVIPPAVETMVRSVGSMVAPVVSTTSPAAFRAAVPAIVSGPPSVIPPAVEVAASAAAVIAGKVMALVEVKDTAPNGAIPPRAPPKLKEPALAVRFAGGFVSRRRASVMLYERWRWTLRSRFVGGGFKPP